MASNKLEKRLAALEDEVSRLRTLVEGKKEIPWWDKIYGTFANDRYYEEAMRLGREYRESLRPKPRKKRKRSDGDS